MAARRGEEPTTAEFESEWDFSQLELADGDDLAAVGGDLKPGTLIDAYSSGLFPMGIGENGGGEIGWWTPSERGVLRPQEVRISKSLRKSCRRFAVSTDRAFSDVIRACADPSRDGRWITPDVISAYEKLHEHGLAHSVEVWRDGTLVGGLYGVALGGLFAGESMFHRERDASKVALIGLCAVLTENAHSRPEATASDGSSHGDVSGFGRLIDMQWLTPHLASLGGVALPRQEYLAGLPELLLMPPATDWGGDAFRLNL